MNLDATNKTEPGSMFSEEPPGLTLPEAVQVASGTQLHHQTAELVGLKMRVQRRKKRVVQTLQYLPLRLGSPDLLPRLQILLIHHLHREEAPSTLQLRQIYTPDVPAPQLLQ